MSVVDVFKDSTDKQISLQQQLHDTYDTDRQLRDKMLSLNEMPNIEEMFSDGHPKTLQEII